MSSTLKLGAENNMAEPDSDEIRGLKLFAEMEQTQYERLLRASYVQNFPPQIELITEGDNADFLHVVLAGTIDLFSRWNDREVSMATVRPVSTFILAATIRNGPYLMSARTLEKSRVMLIPSEDVRAAFDEDNAFARAIVKELAQCYRVVVKNTKDLKLRTSLERLVNYLLRQKNRTGSFEFDLNMEKRRLASFLGMSPENLSRAFKRLEPYGVKVSGSHISIDDPNDLETLAKPNPLIDDYTT